MTTTGNSSPLAEWSVISSTRAARLPSGLSTSESSARRSTNPVSPDSGSAASYSRAADTSSIRFSMRPSASSLRSSRSSRR